MLRHGLALYQQAYVYSQVIECPSEITIDLPKFIRPMKFKGRDPVIADLGLPDYVQDPLREEQLEPWDDPDKTDPLYPYRPKTQPPTE